MPDTKNRTMKAVESMGLETAGQPPPADTGGLELRKGDHPMLPGRYPRDRGVRRTLGGF
jgi:hypothetical protein